MKEKINVTRSSIPDIEEYIEEIRPLWDSRWLTNAGALHNQLKAELKKRAGVPELLLFCNGHLALEAAFSLFPPGSEVITTPFTYISTTLAIIRAGLIPVFCDIEPIYYTLDPKKIESLITEKTVAVVPVHVYGNICDCAGIQEVADRHQLKVIYDAAHAFGETYNGADIGSLGDISMFSFHATKVFNTIEGGCLCLRDPELSQQLTVWKHFGTMGGDNLVLNGTNAKMTEFAAAMGLCNLRHISEWIEMRKKATQRYRDRLGNVPGLILCPLKTTQYPTMHICRFVFFQMNLERIEKGYSPS